MELGLGRSVISVTAKSKEVGISLYASKRHLINSFEIRRDTCPHLSHGSYIHSRMAIMLSNNRSELPDWLTHFVIGHLVS